MSIMLDPVNGAVGASSIRLDDLAPSTGAYLGAVADEAWNTGTVSMLALGDFKGEEEMRSRGLERAPVFPGDPLRSEVYDYQPARRPAAASRLVPIEEANERGRELGLKYDRPVPESFLQSHIAWRRRSLVNQEIFERARADGSYGTGKWLLAGGAELLMTAADPLNLVASMLPVVREARFAIWAQRMGRTGAGVARGAAEGVVGNALVEGMVAPVKARLDPDYTMAEAMLNIALGGVIGGGLHLAGAGIGALSRWSGRRADAPVDANARVEADGVSPDARPVALLAQAVDRTRPETRDAALRVGLAQLNGERALDVEPIVRADPAFVPPRPTQAGGPPRLLTDWPQADSMAEHARLVARAFSDATRPAEPPVDFTPSRDVVEMAARIRAGRPAQPQGREPQTLSQWIAMKGGVRRDGEGGGELMGQDLGRLVRNAENGGRPLDELALAAVEEGFYPQLKADLTRPDLARFIDDIVADAAGQRRTYADITGADAWRAARDANAQMRTWLADHLGVDVKALTPRQLQYLLSLAENIARDQALLRRVQIIERASDVESLDAARALDGEIARAIEAEEMAVRRRLEERGQALEPEEIDVELAARLEGQRPLTLDELEALHAERERLDQSGGEGGRGGGADAGPRGAARAAADGVPDAPAGAAEADAPGSRREGRQGAEGEQGRVEEIVGFTNSRIADLEARAREADRQSKELLPILDKIPDDGPVPAAVSTAARQWYRLREELLDLQMAANYERLVRALPDDVRAERKTYKADYGGDRQIEVFGGPEHHRKLEIYRKSDGALLGAIDSVLFEVGLRGDVGREIFAGTRTSVAEAAMDAARGPQPPGDNVVSLRARQAEDALASVADEIDEATRSRSGAADVKPFTPRATERTDQGSQYLLDGVAAITDAVRAQAGADARLRGGDAAMPEGGLFDTTARRQGDLDDWLKRQADPTNDRHADAPASERATRDAAAGELDARAELDALMAREGKTLSEADKVALEAAARPHEDIALAVEALAQCRVGGEAP